MAKKRKRYQLGPWRLVHKELTGTYEVRTLNGGRFSVVAKEKYVYRRKWGPCSHQYEEQVEYHNSTDLDHILRHLEISEHKAALIELSTASFHTINRLFERWHWYQRMQEDKAREDRKKQRTEKTRMKRVKNKQFGRLVEA